MCTRCNVAGQLHTDTCIYYGRGLDAALNALLRHYREAEDLDITHAVVNLLEAGAIPAVLAH